jgi:acyl carrier protein
MERLKDVLSKVLGVDRSKITDDMSPNHVDSWDSFNGLLLVSELESTFKVKFTMDEVSSARCVGDIKNYLRKHGVVLKEA